MATSFHAVCTVGSKKHLAYVRTLSKSVLNYHPTAKVYFLLVDKLDKAFDPKDEPFELIELQELDNIAHKQYLFFKYDMAGLNKVIKPYFFEFLFRVRDIRRLIYFDANVLVLDSLMILEESFRNYSILLKPYIAQHIKGNCPPSELESLNHGIFNSGFMGLSKSAVSLTFLDWWQRRMVNSFSDMDRWLDLTPYIFDEVKVIRDEVPCLTYHNLDMMAYHELKAKEEKIFLNKKPLGWLHFNGLNEGTKRSFDANRIANTFPQIRPLFENYCAQLELNGASIFGNCEYAYDFFNNSARIPDFARNIYRRLGHRAFRFGDPFSVEESHSFFHWLNCPVAKKASRHPPSRAISRLVLEIYKSRPDLKKAFPKPFEKDRFALLKWVKVFGSKEYKLDIRFLPYGISKTWREKLVFGLCLSKKLLYQKVYQSFFRLRRVITTTLVKAYRSVFKKLTLSHATHHCLKADNNGYKKSFPFGVTL